MSPPKGVSANSSPRTVDIPGPGRDKKPTASLRLMGGTARRRSAPVGHDRRHGDNPAQPRLYDRQAFLNEFVAMFSGSWQHPNGAVVIEGFHWTGRTALLGAACRLAHERHLRVLRARGNHVERGLPWGVVRQLRGDRLPGPTASDGRAGGAIAARLEPGEALGEPELENLYGELDALLGEVAKGAPV